MKTSRLAPVLALALSFAAARHVEAAVKLPALFSDHAVLQRGIAVPVWGTADPGEEVTVSLVGEPQTTKAGADGKWKVSLPAMKAADSLTLTVKGTNTLMVNDVAVGEVWVNSGQSNMAFTLKGDINAEAAIAAANDPQLRFFAVAANASDTPLSEVPGKWVITSPGSAPLFSAVGYYFARELRKALQVPVGMLSTSVGGTPAEAWTSHEALAANPDLKSIFEAQDAAIKGWPAAVENFHKNEARLTAAWQANVEKAKAAGSPPPRKPVVPEDPTKNKRRPSGLYNAMVAPLQPYAIRGAIWYQGEANSQRGKQYRTLFPAMITDWRKAWGEGDFPFFFVQIAPHQNQTPELREAQLLTSQTVPHTAIAVITDFGEPTNIHPKHKEPVGTRLSLAARALAYGDKIEYSGPTFDSLRVDGGKAVLTFQHAAGLVAKDGELKGFTIAGEDKNFVPAKAEIKGATVTVSADAVTKPVAVRYGWTNVPNVNLYNGAGLPASPFRTDVEK
ncbi:MAG: sialate O-acetylesterase [Chthoniobacter sp.]|uniref:sialate O-acetylesterase n=1 Tax=Chthoniobacter sp. TaxID=2510640 RepID=UPI0032AAE13D